MGPARIRVAAVLACLALALPLAGCRPELEPVAEVSQPSSELGQVLTPLYLHRGTYAQALRGLEEHWLQRGYGIRAKWARAELEDLGLVPKHLYERTLADGSPALSALGAGAQPFQIADRPDQDLVEELDFHRTRYREQLRSLIDLLTRLSDARLKYAQLEQEELALVRPYHYLRRCYIPDDLRATQSIAQADRLYEQAIADLDKLRYVPAVGFFAKDASERTAKMGLSKLRRLIEQHPTSDKIDEAAYYMGYFSHEYLRDEEVAAGFFERGAMYNPLIQLPARFRAAICYDYRLHNRRRALELYNESLKEEAFNTSNSQWAAERVRQLTANEDAPGGPPPPME